MGCSGSKNKDQQTVEIEKQIDADKKSMKSHVKLLLLGAGESGKSTIAKQMKIIHLNGFTDEERKEFRQIIFSNVMGSIRVLIEAAQNLGIEIKEKVLFTLW